MSAAIVCDDRVSGRGDGRQIGAYVTDDAMSELEMLGAVIRGEQTDWPASGSAALESAFLAAVASHRVEALVFSRLRRARTFDRWPEAIRTELTRLVHKRTVLELGRLRPLSELLSAFDRAGVRAILFKGAALAYSRYPEPWLRPRNDNDVFIDRLDREKATEVLARLGYAPGDVLTGEFVGHQTPFVHFDRMKIRHEVDLHWKINNRPLLADVLTFEEVWASSIQVPSLGATARAAGDVHALLLACVHPLVHHVNGDKLLWWYDVHLLASRLGRDEFESFAALAIDRRVAAICARGLEIAARHYRTKVPAEVIDRLKAVEGERPARYLTRAAWRGDVRLADLESLSGLRAKLQLIREVAFPNSDYMLRIYPGSSRFWIPALHAHRLVRGTWRLLGRFAG